MNSQSARRCASILGLAAAFTLAGCAVDGQSDESAGETNEALTYGTIDPNAGSSGTFATKPKFDVTACILRKTQDEGWGLNHATAYCECRAKGFSDAHCAYIIPYIDH